MMRRFALIMIFTLCTSASTVLADPVSPPATTTTPATTSTTQTTPATLQGGISQTTAVPAAQAVLPTTVLAKNSLDVKFTPAPPSNHPFQTHTVVIKNNHAVPVEIVQAQVVGGLTGEQVAQMVQAEAQAKAQTTQAVLNGVSGIVSHIGFGGFGRWSYGGARAAWAAANAAQAASGIAAASANMAGNSEAQQYASQIHHQLMNVVIRPGEQHTFTSATNTGVNPMLKLFAKDLQTNQLVDLQY